MPFNMVVIGCWWMFLRCWWWYFTRVQALRKGYSSFGPCHAFEQQRIFYIFYCWQENYWELWRKPILLNFLHFQFCILCWNSVDWNRWKKLSELTPRITTSSPVNQLLELLTIRKKKGIPIELFICLLKCASVFKSHAVEHDCLSTQKKVHYCFSEKGVTQL